MTGLLQAVALLLFATGFFQWTPPAPVSPVHASNPASVALRQALTRPPSELPAGASFDKIVFMVIDALRADFVYSPRFAEEGFPWLRRQQRIKRYIAMARPPTVTLPRLKALTAGTAPRFLDLLANLQGGGPPDDPVSHRRAGPSADSWVGQTSVLHYGDDTWMRLFPGLPGEGTHSFFVTDTVEVDRNVTRHLGEAMDRQDWTVLTLHYLGLDHVGHCGGIGSPLLLPKLREMDEIVARLYGALAERDRRHGTKSLLIVLGDHGMTDGGNHGGASREEVETGCILLSPHYHPAAGEEIERIEQVDIAPTVALLLGLEIPRGSTGRLVRSALPPDVSAERVLDMLRRNALQLLRLLEPGHLRDLLPPDGRWQFATVDEYEGFLREASRVLGADVGEYKMARLVAGILLMLLALLGERVPRPMGIVALLSSVGLLLSPSTPLLDCLLIGYLAMAAILASVLALTSTLTPAGRWLSLKSAARAALKSATASSLLPGLVCLAYAGSQFASTFVEEEHFFWNFVLTTALLGTICQRGVSGRGVLALLLHRTIYHWNSTGYLYQNDPDIKALLLAHPTVEWALWLGCLLLLLGCTIGFAGGPGRRQAGLDLLFGTVAATLAVVKAQVVGGVAVERIHLAGCALLLLACRLCDRRRLGRALCLVLLGLLKRHNAFPLLVLLYLSSTGGDGTPIDALVSLALVHASYFLLGPCHLVASIDFSGAYIGQRTYHPVVVPLLGYLLLWAGPFLVVAGRPLPRWSGTTFRSLVGVALLVCLTLQRHHIFVWTVFAPRLLFEAGWLLFYTLASIV